MSLLRHIALAALIVAGAAGDRVAALSLDIVTDPHTGFAVDGHDPVAYFVDGAPRRGEQDYEATWRGVAWRFANPGNRDAFLDAPEVYAPAYGGHGLVAMARGDAAEGDPRLWAIHGDRLFLFHSAASQRVFALDPDGFIAQADANWRRRGTGPRR